MNGPVSPRRRRIRRTALVALAGAAALPAAALALPTISDGHGPVINPSNQSPDFTIVSPDPGLVWQVRDASDTMVDFGFDASVDVNASLPEGDYTLVASDSDGQTPRAFSIDTTPPAAPVVTTPAAGAEYTVGQAVAASFTCAGVTCDPANGSAVDTSSPGSKTFTVTAKDEAGNTSVTDVPYTVVSPPPVDTAPPEISIGTPAGGQTYALGATVLADFGCEDPGSGVSSCVGTVPNNAPIDTATVGNKTFTVTATDAAGNISSKSVAYQVRDTVKPTVSIASPHAGAYEINTLHAASFACEDNAPGVVCAGTVPNGNPIDTSSLGEKTFVVLATDASGNTQEKQITFEVVDRIKPLAPEMVSPPHDTVTNLRRPKLSWSAASDPGKDGAPGSGIAGYEVSLDGDLVATVSSTTTSWAPDEDLDVGRHRWRVDAVDKAGNVSLANDRYDFTVDPNATAAPAITVAPPAATNDNTPSFAWTGEAGAQEYRWTLKQGMDTVAGGLLSAGSPAVDLGPLKDGDYVFTVTQRTNGNHGTAAAHAFTVDTVPPGALALVVRPAASSHDATPLFGWSGGEPDARYLWQLSGPGGVIVQGPVETPLNAALLDVVPGSYVFQVRQMDAAGNPGPLTVPEPFTVLGGAPPPPPPPPPPPDEPKAPAPTVKKPTKTVKQVKPTTRNAKFMMPRAGVKITSVRPVLRWKTRKGATLYNVQVFRLKGTKLTKVVTAFPRATRYRVPKGKLAPGFRYVWRVWPYVNNRFPAQPLGVSYFDVRQTARSLARSRLLAPRGTSVPARRALTVRWRAKARAGAYKVQVLRGSRVAFEQVSDERAAVVPASALARKGAIRLRILSGTGGSDTAFATVPWAQADLKIR